MSCLQTSRAAHLGNPESIARPISIPRLPERFRTGLPCFPTSGALRVARLWRKGRQIDALPPPPPDGNESPPRAPLLFAFFVQAMPTFERGRSLSLLVAEMEN